MPEDVGYALITSEPTEFALMAVGEDSCSSVQPEADISDAQVSSSTLEKLCSNACIEAFAKIKKANMLLQKQNQELEQLLDNKNSEVEKLIKIKDNEICALKTEKINLQALFDLQREKYYACKDELSQTQVSCEKWVESCKGFKMLLQKQVHSKARFGIGYNHTPQPEDYTPIDNNKEETTPEPISPTFLPDEIPPIIDTPPLVYQPNYSSKFVYPSNTNLTRLEKPQLNSVQHNNSSEQNEIAPDMSSTHSSEETTKSRLSSSIKSNLEKGKGPMVNIQFLLLILMLLTPQ